MHLHTCGYTHWQAWFTLRCIFLLLINPRTHYVFLYFHCRMTNNTENFKLISIFFSMMCKTVTQFALLYPSTMLQLRSLLSWDDVQHRLVITDISRQHIALNFKVCMTLADGTNMLTWNISNKLPTHTTQHPITLNTSWYILLWHNLKQNVLMYKTHCELVLVRCPGRVSVRHLQGFVIFLRPSSNFMDSTWKQAMKPRLFHLILCYITYTL